MVEIFNYFFEFARLLKRKYIDFRLPVDYKGQDVSDKISELLLSEKPCMICRFGSVELDAVRRIDLIEKGKLEFKKEDFSQLQNNAGFFPIKYKYLKRFHDLMIEDTSQIDMYGQFSTVELYFKDYLKSPIKVKLLDLAPFLYKSPWTKALINKKVLVVYPLEETIKSQYKKRKYLFKNKLTLPEFKLITLKSVQSLGGSSNGYKDWFEALKDMEAKISKIDFDIAIIGCGAYGLHLAAYIKRIGKKSIHLGSTTQLLFGIKGKRWESNEFKYVNKHFNSYWVYPKDKDRPKNYKNVENGCYW